MVGAGDSAASASNTAAEGVLHADLAHARQLRESFRALLDEFSKTLPEYDVDNCDDAGRALQQQATGNPQLMDATWALAEQISDAELSWAIADDVREDRRCLKRLLTFLLRNEEMPKKCRKIKAYCFQVSAIAMQSLELLRASDAASCPMLTLSDQASLMTHAVEHMAERTSTVATVSEAVQVAAPDKYSNHEMVHRDAKNALKKARQTVDADGHLVNATMDGLKRQLESDYGCTGRENERQATLAWNANYFTRDLFFVDGHEQTRAEAHAVWVQQGYNFAVCNEYWARLQPQKVGKGKIKPVDPAFAEAEMRQLMESLSQQKASRVRGAVRTPNPCSDRA